MKLLSKKREQGSILVVTLFTGLAVGIVLAGFLTLISSRYNLTARSMGWNAAIPVLEAGLEEALTHLHDDPASPDANGWTPGTVGGQPVYTKERHFTDGSYFYVTIYNANPNSPLIYSQGFVPSPLHTDYISRTVRVTTMLPAKFSKAIQANGGTIVVNPTSSGATIASLSSYPYKTASRGAKAGIATTSTNHPAIKVQAGHVYGTALTGASGTVQVSSGASIGDTNWTSGIEPGWTNNDFNFSFPTNPPPTQTSPNSVSSGTYPYGGTNYTYRLVGTTGGSPAQYYSSSSINIGVGKSMVVTDKAEWYVNSSFTTGGTGFVYLAPGASLTIYVSGTATVSGGGIANGSGIADNLSIIGLSGCTSVTVSGNGDYVGTVNAPQAAMTISGNGNFVGAAIIKSFSLTGNGSVLYPESIGGSGVLTVSSYLEL